MDGITPEDEEDRTTTTGLMQLVWKMRFFLKEKVKVGNMRKKTLLVLSLAMLGGWDSTQQNVWNDTVKQQHCNSKI